MRLDEKRDTVPILQGIFRMLGTSFHEHELNAKTRKDFHRLSKLLPPLARRAELRSGNRIRPEKERKFWKSLSEYLDWLADEMN